MNRYLIIHGSDSEMLTFEADDPFHAVEQFCDMGHKQADITEVLYCAPVIGWENEERSTLYATCNDGSFFGAEDLEIVTVPDAIAQSGNSDEVEDFITNHRGIN